MTCRSTTITGIFSRKLLFILIHFMRCRKVLLKIKQYIILFGKKFTDFLLTSGVKMDNAGDESFYFSLLE